MGMLLQRENKKMLNKVMLIGRLGKDPETKNSATKLNLAVAEKYKEKDTGQYITKTHWFTITLFGKLGEIAQQYLLKGSQVYIEGSLRTSKYADKVTGEDRYSLDIIGSTLQMLGNKEKEGDGKFVPNSHYEQKNTTPKPTVNFSNDELGDDLPF